MRPREGGGGLRRTITPPASCGGVRVTRLGGLDMISNREWPCPMSLTPLHAYHGTALVPPPNLSTTLLSDLIHHPSYGNSTRHATPLPPPPPTITHCRPPTQPSKRMEHWLNSDPPPLPRSIPPSPSAGLDNFDLGVDRARWDDSVSVASTPS